MHSTRERSRHAVSLSYALRVSFITFKAPLTTLEPFFVVKTRSGNMRSGPLRSDQTEIFRLFYAIRPNGIRLDITPTVGFFSAFIIASGTTVVTRKAHALRVTEFSKKAIAQQRKKAASHKRSSLKGQCVPRISGDR